jgi:hypothetical protein
MEAASFYGVYGIKDTADNSLTFYAGAHKIGENFF